MMEYFRLALIWIRKQNNKSDLNPTFIMRLVLMIIPGVIIGVILDILLPFNFFTNMIRGLIANVVGISSFALLYIYSTEKKKTKLNEDRYYKPLRKRLSYRQRVNFSILLSTIIIVFIVIGSTPDSVYTFKAAISILVLISLIAFARKDRTEFIKEIYNLPDLRDLESITKRSKKVEEKDIEKDYDNTAEKEFNKRSKNRFL